MSTRPIGAGEFRNIQKELEALSTQVNSSQKNEGVEKTLETLQQRLDDFLFYGTGIEINDMTQCQVKLDKVRSAFQRGVVAAPSSTTASGSPATPQLVASSQPAPISSGKVFSVSATPSASLSQPPQPQQNRSDKTLSTSLAKLSFQQTSFTAPSANSTSDRQFSPLNTGFSGEGIAPAPNSASDPRSTSLRAFPLELLNMPSYSSSRIVPTTTTTMTATTVTTTNTMAQPAATMTTAAHAQGPASAPPMHAAAAPSSPQKINKDVVKANEQLLASFKLSDFAIYFWVWMKKYSVDDFKQAMEIGAKELTKKDLAAFEAHYQEAKAKKAIGDFDFEKDCRPVYDWVLNKCKEEGSDFQSHNLAYAQLPSFYVATYYDALKSEQEQIYSGKSITRASSPKQIVEANQSFLSLLWMRDPLLYYWTWFRSMPDNGETFKAVTQSGSVLLSKEDKAAFEKTFKNSVRESVNGNLEFKSKFDHYVKEFQRLPEGTLSKNPVFWELFKFYNLDAYNRAIEAKTTHS